MFSDTNIPQSQNNLLLQNLNPEQLAAVTLPPVHALILAGAGSGKTRVLTTRIAWLLQTSQITPGGVMAVTFTNKAAKEMRERVGKLISREASESLQVSTFHALGLRILHSSDTTDHVAEVVVTLDPTGACEVGQRLHPRRSGAPRLEVGEDDDVVMRWEKVTVGFSVKPAA